MADTSGSAFDLCSLISQNNVHSLHTTLIHADKRFIVWTRLSEQNSTWILNISDGVDVWKLELDEEHLQTHRELAEIDKYEAYFAKFRSELQSGNISVSQLASKVTVTLGSGLLPLIYDLYEAKASERKVEMQTVLFRLADNATELSQQLKVANESLERLKAQRESTSSAGPSIFDILPKKSQAAVMKRKQGHSLINPGSRNESVAPSSLGLHPEGGFHMSILTGSQSLDIYKCSDANCQFMCSLSNKRYHCPLCDNKPQKPGRMRRHFIKMHSGKQLVQHGRFRMLRCKLKCTRANGRLTENSHYHCCLCGRVLIRKVHLYCHLQAHSFGSADDVDEDAMDDGKDEEEPEEEADVDDDEAGHSSALDSSHMSGNIVSSQPESVVALTDGTQVVYVQSIQSGETLAVVPIDGHPDNMQLSQAQQNQLSPVVTTSTDLSTQLQVLTSSADTGQMGDLEVVPEELPQGMEDSQDPSALAEEVEAILNQGEENVTDLQITDTGDQGQLGNLDGNVATLEQYAGQPQPDLNSKLDTQSDIEITQDTEMDTSKDSEVDAEPMEFDSPLAHLSMTPSAAVPQEPNQILDVDTMAAVTEALSSQPANLDVSSQLVNSTAMTSSVGSLQTSVLSITTAGTQTPTKPDYKYAMLTPDGTGATPSVSSPPQSSRKDSLVLLETNATPKGDDEVFKFIVSTGAEQSCCCYNHPSVLGENQTLNIDRCKNTDCDCRLYHCPLCTCLPNKPGRIREHFKKIHAEELIIRYRGLQMLRCKLGCSRPNGKKVFNSHYHCCVCGHICIRKSGLYEHMRVQHSEVASKITQKTDSCCSGDKGAQDKQKEFCHQSPADQSKTNPSVSATAVLTPVQPGSLQPEETENQAVQSVAQAFATQVQPGGAGNQQAVTVQIPPLGEGQSGTGQQLVIVMPQQTPQGQGVNSTQSQQPIVIVMPQMAAGQVTQPVIVPVPNTNN